MQVLRFSARAVRRALAPLALAMGVGSLAGAASPIRGAPAVPTDTLLVADALGAFDALESSADRGAADSIVSALTGVSGKLRAHFIVGDEAWRVPGLAALLGGPPPRAAQMRLFDLGGAPASFALIAMRPFADKVRGRIGPYRMGYWPAERTRTARTPRYAPPPGFIEVTPENQDTYVSEHFRLRDFLTKDQQHVWPKYLALDTRLLDKLELVIAELERDGVPVTRLAVMSGFRTPQYNAKGVGKGGRAATSRHQYGDAADVFVDNDADGWTDDVNRDGRVTVHDADVVRRAVERVDAAYPELIGGVGVYPATRAHGPFTHVDARGYQARWGAE